jgi:transcriptional regulator with XRE-family HTH domain
MILGNLLKRFREERGFSLGELGTLAKIDRAYIHRLETGEKDAPSEEVLSALVRALKLDSHRARILKFMVSRSIHDRLVEVVLEKPEYTVEDLESAAVFSFRGTRPDTKEAWERVLKRIQQMRKELENGG